jgi:single-strand DNA-binding protein
MGATKTTPSPAPQARDQRGQPPTIPSTDERVLPPEVHKVGNLTRDPALEFGRDSGRPFARFGLAENVPATPGDWSELTTEFYEVTAFGTLAENICTSLTKGMRAIVVGRPEIDAWTDGDGNARETRRILANACGPDLRWATATLSAKRSAKPTTPAFADDVEPF